MAVGGDSVHSGPFCPGSARLMEDVMTLTQRIGRYGHWLGAAVMAVGLVAVWPLPALAQPAERLSDKEVKNLIEQVDQARDKFEGNLDDKFKSSTIRGATRETSVSAFLQDLQDNVSKLKDRFTDDYSASAEADTVFKQTTGLNTYMQTATVTKGRSEFDKLVATLKSLAAAYDTTFPLPEGAVVRRMNDKEVAAAAAAIANAADQYKKQIDLDKTALAIADKERGKKAADDLIKAAQTLKSRIEDGKPASAEAQAVVKLTAALEAFNAPRPVTAGAAALSMARTAVGKLQQAFHLATP